MAEQVANNPSASFSEQMETWGDLQAAYRLFDQNDVTFEAIARPHWEQTRRVASGRCLVINDTTELDFGKQHAIEGLSAIDNRRGRGLLLHNAILVAADNLKILGVAGQRIHYRQPRSKNDTAAQRLKRERESKVWGELIDDVGRPTDGVQYVHVCDRGADGYEVFCHLVSQQVDWVVRASSLQHVIMTPDGETLPLSTYLPTLPLAGTYQLHLRTRRDQPARIAKLEVRCGELRMPAPEQPTPYVKSCGLSSIPTWVVEVCEVDAPKGVKPSRWVLYTSLPVTTFDEAWLVIESYEACWRVEEYDKALKTGCRVAKRTLQEATRLEPIVGLMSVEAVRLLQLKSVARSLPDQPARQVVPHLWLVMLKAARKNLRRVSDVTIREFYREVAKLGGFLGRKSDGEPGWITIWRGWQKLNTMVQGAELALQFQSELENSG